MTIPPKFKKGMKVLLEVISIMRVDYLDAPDLSSLKGRISYNACLSDTISQLQEFKEWLEKQL